MQEAYRGERRGNRSADRRREWETGWGRGGRVEELSSDERPTSMHR